MAPCAVALPALAAVARGLDDASDLSLRTLAGEVLAYKSYRAELVESRRRRKPRPTFPECDAQILRLDVALDGPGDVPPLAASLAGVRCVRTLSDAGHDATTTTVEGTLGAALGATVLARAAKRAKFPTSKAPISAVFHSFWLIFARAIISRNGLEAWMLFTERARAKHSR